MNGSSQLAEIMVASDRLAVSPAGALTLDGHDASELIASFGSPLYVTVEATLRQNYNAILNAFQSRWPGGVDVFYAIKTNNALAIRSVLNHEGAGGECFGPVELQATVEAGVEPGRIILNGSDKNPPELYEAARLGATINIDGEDEISLLDRPGLGPGPTRVNLRLKLLSDAFDAFSSEFFKTDDGVREAVRRSKWGYSVPAAVKLVRRIRASSHMELVGYSCHVGRFSNLPESFAVVGAELVKAARQIHDATGFWPDVLDLGGGWARQREPESRAPSMNPYTIDDYAQAVTDALKAENGDLTLPRLWLEPGRYIVGNAVVLLSTVGAVKHDLGRVWAHVDASTNQLMRIDTSRSWHAILPASRMNDACDTAIDVVGPTCIPSILGSERSLPLLRRGDIVAILDAGMYAEVIANQFNGMPRPANVLVSASGAEVIRERETYEDVFARHRIPDRLRPTSRPRDAR